MKMFCNYCNTQRPQNEAPCPNCGAPSPLLEQSQVSNWAWGNGQNAQPMPAGPMTAAWGDGSLQNNQSWGPLSQNVPGGAVPPQQPWGNQPSQAAFEASPALQPPPQSMLPVPYQSQMGMQPVAQQNVGLPAFPTQDRERMLPALPAEDGGAVYVPPMYTKPRPIVPTYRIISGTLSVIIVALLLCGGAGYYAKASGKLSEIQSFLTGAPPGAVTTGQGANLPDPPERRDTGPASNTIPAASTTTRVDPVTKTPLQQDKVFKPSQVINLTFSINGNSKGTVTTKWYMDDNYYQSQTLTVNVPDGKTDNVIAQMIYVKPAEGKVELYWNGQLAQRLFFVVR